VIDYRLVKSTDAAAAAAAEADSAQLVPVNFDITWTAITRCFDFDVDLSPDVLCDAVAREPWSREFFNNLRAYVSYQLAHLCPYCSFLYCSSALRYFKAQFVLQILPVMLHYQQGINVVEHTPCPEKKGATLFLPVTLRNVNQFSKFFHHRTLH